MSNQKGMLKYLYMVAKYVGNDEETLDLFVCI